MRRNKEHPDALSVTTRSWYRQLVIAYSLMTVIPLLALGYFLVTYLLPNVVTRESLLLVIILCLFLSTNGFIILSKMLSSLHKFKVYIEAVSEGDLDQTLSVSSGPEINSIAEAIHIIVERLREDRNRAKELLKTSQECFHNIVENSSDGVIVTDSAGMVRFVNSTALSIFGRQTDDMTGELFGLAIVPGNTLEIDIVRQGGMTGAGELRVVETEWRGEPANLLLIRDITDRNEKDQALRASEEIGRVLMNAATDAALLLDREGVVLAANETAAESLGTSAEELKGVNFYDVLPKDQATVTREHIERAIRLGAPERYEETRAGAVHGVGIFPVFDDRGNVDRVAVFSRDITREKAIDRMKTEFVSIASHELRTPLSNITEAVAQVTDGIYGEVNPEQRAVLGIAHRNCERLGRLIHDLLDISRIESGKIVLHRTFVDMGELVRTLCDMYQADAGKKGLTLRVDVGGGLPAAFGDADRLEQVLVNLIGNALKFTPSGGTVAVKMELKQDHIRCVVSDTGMGISPEQLDTVFDKFVTIASAAHGGDSGTGLGLAIARQLVQLHGGEIWVESKPEQGSRFVFTLPDYQSEAALTECLARQIVKADAARAGISLLGIRPTDCPELRVNRGGSATPFLHKLRDAIAEGLGAGVNIWSLAESGELMIVSDGGEASAAKIRQAVLHQHGKYRFSVNETPIEFGLQLAVVCHPGDAADAQPLLTLLRERVSKAAPFANAPKNVLLVDDDERAVETLDRYLRQPPIRTLTAHSGEQALELAAAEPPDLILLDMGLPGISGYEVIGRLKGDARTTRIPLIIVTGQDIDKTKLDPSQSVIPVLSKPIAQASLIDQVYRLLNIEVIHE